MSRDANRLLGELMRTRKWAHLRDAFRQGRVEGRPFHINAPLTIALKSGDVEAVRRLVQWGSNANFEIYSKVVAAKIPAVLYATVEHGGEKSMEINELLLKRKVFDPTCRYGKRRDTPLHILARDDVFIHLIQYELMTIRRLLEAGVSNDIRNADGELAKDLIGYSSCYIDDIDVRATMKDLLTPNKTVQKNAYG